MNDTRLQRLFADILALPAHERASFIERECAGQDEVAEEVRGLLGAHEAASARPGFLAGLDREAAARLIREGEAVAADQAHLANGTELGHYTIEGMLGEGGMGVVYLAHDRRLDRKVALKLLPPHLRADGEARRRLADEARAASGLDHPNVAPIYDIVDSDDGPSFIAMAYCEGPTLKEILAGGALPEAEAVAIVRQIADGLSAAHGRGVIHRDIKPANIIVAPGGWARIVDFGIARLMDSVVAEEVATPGTIAYMSPEQTTGGEIDHRSDLWSLGVVFHEMLTGRRPFEGQSDAALLRAIRTESAPADAHPVVRRALDKDPAARYQSAGALLSDLEPPAGGTAGAGSMGLWSRRSVAAAAVVAATGLVALMFGPLRPDSRANATGEPAPRAPLRLAMLPLEHDADSSSAIVAATLGDDLASRLGGLAGLRLIGTQSARAFEDSDLEAAQIGDSLGVDVLLHGGVTLENDTARVTLRLVDVASGEIRWSDTYPVGDADESHAADVIRAMNLDLTAADERQLAERGTSYDEAFRAYRRGRYYWNRRDPEGLLRAQQEFERAIDLDPAYADPWAGLAEVYLVQGSRGSLPPASANPLSREAAEHAIALQPDHAGALTVLAAVQHEWYYDRQAAEESFQRALVADPGYATAHYWYSEFLSFSGRFDEALEHAKIAQELEPLMLTTFANEARAYYMSRRFEEAIVLYEAILERGWDFTSYLYPPLAHSQLGQHELAISKMARFVEAVPGAYERYLSGYVFARAGRQAEADSVLAEALAVPDGEIPAIVLAAVYVGRGDTDRAMQWLERSYENHEWQIVFLEHDPLFDPLRDDPRFQALLARTGL